MNPPFSLTSKKVLVLGGTSGIGRAVAIGARTLGADVTIVSRRHDRSVEVAAEIGATARAADITKTDSLRALLVDTPHIDHIYIAAGSFIGGQLGSQPVNSFRASLDDRVWGAAQFLELARSCLAKDGSVVLTGGVSTDRPAKEAWATAVATAASEQLARVMSLELAPVRVNAVAPGWTDTPMWDAVFGDEKAESLAEVAARIPVGRVATAEEAAAAVLFLMTNGSVNGEVVHVDGGLRHV